MHNSLLVRSLVIAQIVFLGTVSLSANGEGSFLFAAPTQAPYQSIDPGSFIYPEQRRIEPGEVMTIEDSPPCHKLQSGLGVEVKCLFFNKMKCFDCTMFAACMTSCSNVSALVDTPFPVAMGAAFHRIASFTAQTLHEFRQKIYRPPKPIRRRHHAVTG